MADRPRPIEPHESEAQAVGGLSESPGTLRSWVEDGALCGVAVGLVVALPTGFEAGRPDHALLALGGGLLGGTVLGVVLRASLRWSVRASLVLAVPLGAAVSAWVNSGLARVWGCFPGCPGSDWYTPLGYVVGTLVGLTWLGYAPVRHRGREGTWILLGALLAGAALLVPLYVVSYEQHLH